MNKSTDIREPSYERSTTAGHPNRMHFFLPRAVGNYNVAGAWTSVTEATPAQLAL